MKRTSVHIETHGCQMNVADTERGQQVLRQAGYEIAQTAETADVVILNTCSVRARAEAKVHSRIGQIRHSRTQQPLIGVMGCVAQLEGENLLARRNNINFVAGTQATARLPEIIERALTTTVVDTEAGAADWDITRARTNRRVAFVPIIEGCNKFCSYCIVPYSRGRERSRAAHEILEEIKHLYAQGFLEVHLIGQNVNSYRPQTVSGMEKYGGATPFARLLRAVAGETQMPRIKFTTSFPRDFHADIITAMDEHESLCNWVHLPVQSGSDRVLRQMRRGYRRADYLERVAAIKAAKKKMSLTSDIIIGYPSETIEEFEETVSLVEQCQYDGLYIFKYSERRGTPAAKTVDDVSEDEKRRRFEVLEQKQKSIQQKIYESYIGTTVEVLVNGTSARHEHEWCGHTTCHKVVNFRFPAVSDASADASRRAEKALVKVKITAAKPNSLYGVAAE